MEKALDYNTLEEGSYKRSIILLYQKLIKLLPAYFTEQQVGVMLHESFAEIVIGMNEQHMLEMVVSELEEKLHIHVLYASREEDGRIYRVVAYSTPLEDEMFILYLSSTNYGTVSSMTVFFFDSLETMCCQLLKERTRMPKLPKDILEKESYSQTLSNFN